MRNPGISLQTKLCRPPCGACSEVLGDFQSFGTLLSPYLAQSALCQIPPWLLHVPQKVGMPSVHRPFRGDEAEGLWRAPPNPPARTWVAMVSTPPLVPLLEGRRRRIALRLAVLVQNTPSSSTTLPEPNQGRVHTGHPPLSLEGGKQRGRARRSLRRGGAQTWRVFTVSNRVTYSQTFWCTMFST